MNKLGELFSINIFGGSHSDIIGVIIDGCPSGISISSEDFYKDLSRRKTGSEGTSLRIESDIPIINYGINNGITSGETISILFKNENIRKSDYDKFKDIPRPGHSDFVRNVKYQGYADLSGGGQSSGRMTLPMVAAGVIAKKIISEVDIKAELIQIGSELAEDFDNKQLKGLDSFGGIVECRITNCPIGLGEPFFSGIKAKLSQLIFSLPGIIGLEFGAGFCGASLNGSEFNDAFINGDGKTKTNNSGGINGGISNGNEIIFRAAVKPSSSISLVQETYDIKEGKSAPLIIEGRHDRCFALRLPPVIEAVAAIVLADLKLIHNSKLNISK